MNDKFILQRGVSLISLMVGMVISLIVILGMLAVYKTTIGVTVQAGQGATTDGQRLSALLSAQTVLQGAGYGIDGAALGKDLVVLAGAGLDGGKTLTGASAGTAAPLEGNAIVWGTKIDADGSYECSGFYAPATGGLVRLPAVACNSAGNWNSVGWSPIPVVEDTRVVTISLGLVTAAEGCKSFGIGGAGRFWVRLQTTNSTDTDATATTCLSNFSAT